MFHRSAGSATSDRPARSAAAVRAWPLRLVALLALVLAPACSVAQRHAPGAHAPAPTAAAFGADLKAPALTPPAPTATSPAPPLDPATLAVEQSPAVQQALERLAQEVESARRQAGIAGISAGVVYNQTLIWSQGFGAANVATGTAATPETLYRVGSITKLFTDTMMLQLRDQGKLRLDDPLEQYLPELQIPSAYGDDAPTLRELASHTAGLPREAPLDYWRTRAFPTESDLIASLTGAALIGPPGHVYAYSNLGVSLEGIALERIAGVPYPKYVTQNILAPLGMLGSGFAVTDDVRARLAAGSTPAGPAAARDPYPDFGALTPAAGLYTSVDDIARFISLQFRTSDADAGPVLSGPALREMHDPASRGGPSDFGIGWEFGTVAGHQTIGHPGFVYGFTTQITLAPDARLGVAVFTNGRANTGAIADEMLATLLAAIGAAANG